jgi:hypothetical protein
MGIRRVGSQRDDPAENEQDLDQPAGGVLCGIAGQFPRGADLVPAQIRGRYCFLPHVVELAQTPYDRLFPISAAQAEIKVFIDPFFEVYRNKMQILK